MSAVVPGRLGVLRDVLAARRRIRTALGGRTVANGLPDLRLTRSADVELTVGSAALRVAMDWHQRTPAASVENANHSGSLQRSPRDAAERQVAAEVPGR